MGHVGEFHFQFVNHALFDSIRRLCLDLRQVELNALILVADAVFGALIRGWGGWRMGN